LPELNQETQLFNFNFQNNVEPYITGRNFHLTYGWTHAPPET